MRATAQKRGLLTRLNKSQSAVEKNTCLAARDESPPSPPLSLHRIFQLSEHVGKSMQSIVQKSVYVPRPCFISSIKSISGEDGPPTDHHHSVQSLPTLWYFVERLRHHLCFRDTPPPQNLGNRNCRKYKDVGNLDLAGAQL